MTSPAPGWYPDPGGTAPLRWWDGQTWTDATSAASAATPPGPVPTQAAPYGFPPDTTPGVARRSPATGWHRNQYAFFTFGIVALYIWLSVATHFVLIGFIPLAMSFRSRRAREPLAPVAMGAAIVAIVVSIAVLTGH